MKKIFLIFTVFIFMFCAGCGNAENTNNNSSIKEVNVETNSSTQSKSDNIAHGNSDKVTNTDENEAQNDNIDNEKKEEIDNEKSKKKVSGLLLGLKKTTKMDNEPTQYETLWIFQEDENIIVRRGKDFLSVPYGDSFYKIQNQIYEDEEFFPEAEDKSEDAPLYSYDHKFHFIDTVAYPFGSESAKIYGDTIERDWPITTTKDEVLFAGNKYILINEDSFETGGGTFSGSWYNNSLYELKDLGKYYKKNTVDLKKFISFDETTIENYKKEYNKDLNEDEELKDFITYTQEVNEKNPLIVRKDGHWTAQLPIEEIYAHQGNGSIHTNVDDFLDFTDKVSDELLSYDDLVVLFETIKKQIPDARDAVSSPNGSMLAVLVNDRIDIYLYPDKEDKLEEPKYSIPISAEQSIVSNQWATNDYAKLWDDSLKKELFDISR